MLRKPRLLLLAVIAAAMSMAAMLGPSAANAVTVTAAPACSGVIAIDQFAFNPASVPAGQTAALTLVAQNCTNQTFQGTETWFGKYTWPGTGIPPGCPAIDPAPLPFTLAAGATVTTTVQDGDTFQSCLATGLQETVEFSVATTGTIVAQATADLTIVQPKPPLACHVSYTPNIWPGGFTGSVTIGNTGTATFNGWTLTFTFQGDEHITNAWNAAVSQALNSVSATNLSYNATIPPGGSQSFGFQGTWLTSNAPPAGFSVNGVACT